MYSRPALRQKKVLWIVLLVSMASVLFTACGTKNTVEQTGSTAASRAATVPPSTPTTRSVVGYGTANGCPNDVVIGPAPAFADITVGPQHGSGIIDVRKGDLIEIQMPFGLAWEGPQTSQGVLQLQVPFGYAWKPSHACIWRFVATGSGSAAVSFSGRAMCKKPALCVPSEVNASFTFQVS